MYALLHKPLNRIKFILHKLCYATYYKLFFGRRFPWQRIVASAFHAWEKQWRKGDIPVSRGEWESQYRNGRWKFMRALDELPRYSLIAGYFQYLKPGGSLLDVGCGEGLLPERLGPSGYSKYVGIDISEAAIIKASSREDEKTVFVCANAASYNPTELFDAIIFNETLYYFDEPLRVVEKYKQFLKKDGVMITSLYLLSDRSLAIWKKLKAIYSALDEVKVTNKSKTWVLGVFANSARSHR